MTLKIIDIMSKRLITAQKHHSAGHLRQLIERNRIHAIPVLGPDEEVHGIVTTADLAGRVKDTTPASRIMTREVVCVPAYNNVSVAARIMRKRKIHHIVVTNEKKAIGMISSFDLLRLIEGKRFVQRNAPASARAHLSRSK